MRKIIKYIVNDRIKIKATQYDQATSDGSTTTGLRATGRWIGWLGRMAVMDYFTKLGATVKVKRIDYEIFLEIDGQLFQVKTATRRTMEDPQPEWSALIELPNWEKWEDHESHLLFVYYYENDGVFWFGGIGTRKLFHDKGEIHYKGEKFGKIRRTPQDCIAVEIKDLHLMENWLIKHGYRKTIQNMEHIRARIRQIFKKYALYIFKHKGNIWEYVFRIGIGQDPSQFANRELKEDGKPKGKDPPHLRAMVQYADLIREQLGNPDIPDDEIIPAGTTATFVKVIPNGKQKDTVLLPELATMEDLNAKAYVDGMSNVILQLIEILGFTKKDLEFGFRDGNLNQQAKLGQFLKGDKK
jgi:hypothetical protein